MAKGLTISAKHTQKSSWHQKKAMQKDTVPLYHDSTSELGELRWKDGVRRPRHGSSKNGLCAPDIVKMAVEVPIVRAAIHFSLIWRSSIETKYVGMIVPQCLVPSLNGKK